MSAFSPVAAASEGLRVIRREPKAVLSWIGVWGLALVVVGVIQVVTVDPAARPETGAAALTGRFGPLWPVLIPTILILWIMTTATLFRAVLRPAEHGWHLFKLGADEARLGLITAVASLLILVLGSGPALVLWVLARPVVAAVPASGRAVATVGTIATVCLELWIAVRLSLAPVHTFAEGRFHLVGYWRLTRGRFWLILLSYGLVALQIAALVIALAVVVILSGWAGRAIGAPEGLDLVRRGLLLGLVAGVAVLGAVLFVVPLTLICACQALAYAAIIAPEPGAPWGPSGGGARARRDPPMPGL